MTQQNQIQQPNTTRRIRRGLAVAGLSLAPFALLAAPGVADQHNPMIKTAAAETAGGSSDEDRSFSGAAYDAFLEGRLVTAYTVNRNLNPFDLSVDVKNQKATIGGAVETEAQRALAVEIASGIDAITDVDSEIKIQADVVDESERGLGDRVDDASTTAAVKTRLLANDATSGLSIDVDTHSAVVTLSGQVDTATESDLATQIAMNTDGVIDVVNKLTVETS
ncbi:BON domain-containing protein [Abyssibacter sp.]|uniref:BON domain-containing protein n=1 Tax=Abyssibacter sp. TaxID=2320200 RepID=UPI0025B91755|nr:BON domain-containing protein [Abyssibacter sp.]MCK5859260.1 BON domain-containing protein [Abyssibacter sp.]